MKPIIDNSSYYAKCHRNVKINSHNCNRYPLLFKNINAKFGRILECQKYNILCSCNTGTHVAFGLRAYILGKAWVPVLQLLHVSPIDIVLVLI